MSTRRSTASRSEEVRQRRSQEQVKRQKKAVERAYRPLPPVTSRSRSPRLTPRSAQAERRFGIAISLPRDQVQGLSLPRIRPGWRLASFLLGLVLAAVLYLLWTLPYFRVTEAQVTGAARLSPAEINAVLGVSGQPIFTVRPDELAARLRMAFTELSAAAVTVRWPNQVMVEVTERQPVLLWQLAEGYTWIDATGVSFRPRGEVGGLIPIFARATPPYGASVTDDPFSPLPYLAPDLVKSVHILAASLPAGASLVYDANNGFGWVDPQGWQVFFGEASKDMALKLRVYQSLSASLTARGIYPAFISVVHVDAPYYRMEP
ncbi:MAG: cell division protein FtsQ/DivIB [Chloroflexota bacterium]